MTDTAILRSVPLDRLVLPSDDVRDSRSDEAILDIASSMGDPAIGQQTPINVYPADYDEHDNLDSREALQEHYETDVDLVIHDGVTRFLAAKQLGWSDLRAEILPAPPHDEIMARLSANTDRSDMSDHEVFSALKDHYERTDATLEDVGDKLGVNASYVSRVFNLFDAPDYIYQPWADEQHPLTTSHAMAVRSLLSENTVDEYAEAGDLVPAAAAERAEQDAQMMVEVQADRDLAVTEFRKRVKRLKKQTKQELRDQRGPADKQADGQTASATASETPQAGQPVEDCTVCGCGRHRERRKAIQVCDSCHAELTTLEQHGDTLLDADSLDGLDGPGDEDAVTAPTPTHKEAMSFIADLPQDAAAKVLQSLQSAPQEASGD